jgi:hypothetical protein
VPIVTRSFTARMRVRGLRTGCLQVRAALLRGWSFAFVSLSPEYFPLFHFHFFFFAVMLFFRVTALLALVASAVAAPNQERDISSSRLLVCIIND